MVLALALALALAKELRSCCNARKVRRSQETARGCDDDGDVAVAEDKNRSEGRRGGDSWLRSLPACLLVP